jgi:hypothetical protein
LTIVAGVVKDCAFNPVKGSADLMSSFGNISLTGLSAA